MVKVTGDPGFSHPIFIYILKQKGRQHNKQCGESSCIIRMNWRKNENMAKMALQISTECIYNGVEQICPVREEGDTVIEKCKRILSGLSLFWRYFFLLAAVVLVFFLAFTVATGQFTRVLQETYLKQAQNNFEKNAQLFVRDVSLTHSLPGAMEETQYYSMVSNGLQWEEGGSVLDLTGFSGFFSLQCRLLDLPDEGFVYFKNSGMFITRYRIFSEPESCFNSYIVYEDMEKDMPELLRTKEMSLGFQLLPAHRVSVKGVSGNYMTLLVPSSRRDAVYGILYPIDTILEYFQVEHLPENTYFELTSADGTQLLSWGDGADARKDVVRMETQLTALSCTASVGIPTAYFRATVRSAQTVAQVVFLISVAIGIALCFLFSYLSVKPFHRLLRDHAAEQTSETSANELLALDHFLKSTRERNMALRNMLLSSLLVRAFSGLTIPEEEYRKISDAFPMFRRPMRAAVVRDRTSEHAMEESSAMITLLRSMLPESFLCEYINIQESVILFSDLPETCELLQNVLLELNAHPERGGRFACGISAPFLGANEMGQAIRQAQFCIPENADHVIVQIAQENTGEETVAAELDLKQLQQALACWNRQEVLIQMERIAAFAGKNSQIKPQELFYSTLFLLRDTADSGKLSFEDHEKMAYEPTSSPVANLRRLKGIVNDLFEQKAAMQLSDKQLLCEEIVQYIRNNYSDATLCLASLAKEFCVSERFVYNAVMEVTGMNVSGFMVQCRMQEAARLLRGTDENVSSIAEKCGYPVESTFYRNFKKYYHMTPADYKSGR